MSSSGPGCERGERSHAMPCSRVRCHNMWRKRRRFFKYKWRQCLLVFARWQSRVHRVISWLNARLARTSHFKCNKVFLPWVQQSLTSIKLNLMAYLILEWDKLVSQVSMKHVVNLSQIKILRQWRRCWNYRIVLNFPFILYGPKYLQFTIIYCCMKHPNNDKN